MLAGAALALMQSASAPPLQGVHGGVDSVRMDQSPLPGGVASVFRFLFSGVPQWVQIGGVVVGVIVAVVLAVVAWRRRAEIATWLRSRTSGYRLALGAGVGTVLLSAGLVGGWSYHYMMNENDFCSSCHVMKPAFGKFQTSEHSKLKCHDCHQQSLFASSRELYYWVMDRPDKIPAHSKVPNRICADCHITEKRDSVWQFVSATAGHQVHLRSDSAALRDVMCVTCHARQVHAFAPTDVSCKESGCHDKITVRLGKMADQTSLHCTTCHEFSRPVDALAPLDSGRQGLVPRKPQCFTCHEMREKLAGSGLDRDPHKGNCGICHNPHTQEKASGAIKSCATSECHANADTLTAFHRGLPNHALDQCTACHKAHTWKVASTQCIACHKTIFQDRPPAASRGVKSAEASGGGMEGTSSPPARRGGPSADDPEPGPWSDGFDPSPSVSRAVPVQAPPAAGAPFPHSRHRSVTCTTCHSNSREHGQVIVRDQAACQGCHHATTQRAECSACHATTQLAAAKPVEVSIHVSSRATDVRRTLQFGHPRHATLACGSCHADDVGRSVVKSCASCHTDHHSVARDCAACHPTAREGHSRQTHDGCAACHTDAVVAALPPVRAVCLGCHAEQRAHYAAKECVACHRLSWNETKTTGAPR
ncbi:MAG: hypothetical protein ABI910_07665 [Gemmatimonadota bacterium]